MKLNYNSSCSVSDSSIKKMTIYRESKQVHKLTKLGKNE